EYVVVTGGGEIVAEGCLATDLDVAAGNVTRTADPLAGSPRRSRASVPTRTAGAARAPETGDRLVIGKTRIDDVQISIGDVKTSAVAVAAISASTAAAGVAHLATASAGVAAVAAVAPSPTTCQVPGEVGLHDLKGTRRDMQATS